VDSVSNLDLQFSKIDASCQLQNGSIQAQALGGTLPFTYSWHQAGLPAVDQQIGLGEGTYAVTLTDGNGCQTTDSISLSNSPGLSLSGFSNDATCLAADGSASVNVSGGTAPFSYSWHMAVPQFNATATGLAAGSYTVTVSDSKGCSEDISIAVNSTSNLSMQLNKVDASCQLDNGAISVHTIGGTAPFIYSWHHSGASVNSAQTNLADGTYGVTVIDAKQCEFTDFITLTNSPAVTVDGTSQPADCQASNGEATVWALTGTAPFTYSWDLGTPQYNATATDLAAGVYQATVVDGLGCVGQIGVWVDSINRLDFDLFTFDPSCNLPNGSVKVEVNNGSAPYQFDWHNASGSDSSAIGELGPGNYQVTVMDQAGCHKTETFDLAAIPSALATYNTEEANCLAEDGGITVQAIQGTPPFAYSWHGFPQTTGPELRNVSGGTYGFTLIDSLGCAFSTQITIGIVDSFQAQTLQIDSARCELANGSIAVMGTGGEYPFAYQWQEIEGLTDSLASDIAGGIYSVSITDANGCVDQLVVELPNSGSPPEVDLGPDLVVCQSAVLDASASGLEWYWSTGATTPTITVEEEGAYGVAVGNEEGCRSLDAIYVEIIPAPAPEFYWEQDTLNPFAITFFNLTAGYPGDSLQYLWDFGDGTTSKEVDPYHFYSQAGAYEVTLTAMGQCDGEVSHQRQLFIEPDFLPSPQDLIDLYPNPNNGKFRLVWKYPYPDDAEIKVLTQMGQYIEEFSLPADVVEKEFDFEHLSAGMYYLWIKIGNESYRKTWIVKH
jgi:hypothetical protein